MRFELSTLDNYDEKSIIEELRRVASLIPDQRLTIAKFDELSKVHSTTVRKYFGSWAKALSCAGLESKASELARKIDTGKTLGKEKIAALIKQAAMDKGVSSLTRKEFSQLTGIGQKTILARFNSWREALSMAGLEPVALGKRYTELECYENLLTLWMHYGRQPKYGELKLPPSSVGPKAYVVRWGSWRKALRAFVDYAEDDSLENDTVSHVEDVTPDAPSTTSNPVRTRHIPLKVRYNILKRDRFACTVCGRTPATTIGLELHIDHKIPWSKGGLNDPENLATLCSDCNLGKGDQYDIP